jgi:nucleotide-binding universal stress UspA family protein
VPERSAEESAMTVLQTVPQTIPSPRDPVETGGDRNAVVACLDDGGDERVLAAAIARAGREGGPLVVYAVGAVHAFSSVRRTWWSADGDPAYSTDLLSPVQLERLGEHGIAVAVQRARRAGVDAWGWLPRRRGVAGIGRYAVEHAAGVVVLAAGQVRLAAALREWAGLEVVTA